MADKPTKPKRDLRARLGRTITPKTQGGAEPAAPPDVGGAAAPAAEAPAPAVKAPAVKGPPAGIAPPVGVVAPPAAIGGSPFSSTPDIAPPPFARPAAAPQQQVVRLEFDDKLVTDQEVGKGTKTRTIIIAAVVALVGIGVGFGVGSMIGQRELFKRTVRDAQDIYHDIDEASRAVTSAQTHMNAIIAAAAGDPNAGTGPAVAYSEIEALRALHKPLEANAFATRNYHAMSAVVGDLFAYLRNIDQIWESIQALAAETLAENRRPELDRTATEIGEAANTQYGAVLQRTEDGQLMGSLAFLEISQGEDGTPHVNARGTRGGAAREFQVFSNADDQEIGTTPAFVMLIDGAASRGVLVEQTGAYGRYLQRIRDLKLLIDQTVEIQGRLITGISTALTEAGASTTPED